MKPDQYAVVGNPIEHSKSPFIHHHFAKQTGELLEYTKLLAPIDSFTPSVKSFFKQGGKGLNITVPFKLDAFNFADYKNERADFAGAANTLIMGKDGKVTCDNTDGVGIVRDIEKNQGQSLKGKKILILGAGGAVQGVLQPILKCLPKFVFIANRTASKAHTLAEHFAGLGLVNAGGFTEIPMEQFDVIINGTAASLSASVPAISVDLIHANCLCYDMMYANEGTAFTKWASEQGAVKVSDGLGMLVEQAAESFYLWRGVRPETKAIMKLMRST